jgi:kumamolisin
MAGNRKVFNDSVTPLPQQLGTTPHGLILNAAQPDNRNESMTLLFSVAIPDADQAELEARVARGETVSPQELQSKYSPKAADLNPLKAWLKEQGFVITQVAADNSGVYARATVAQIEKALSVNMVRVTKDGITYTAAQDAPSLPDNIGQMVHAIIGLQPFRHAHKHFRVCIPHGHPAGGRKPAARAKAAAGPSKSASSTGFHVSQIMKAYNADGLKLTGKGQTIAILIDTFPSNADLKKFWKLNKVKNSTTNITRINVNSITPPPPSGEETMDVEWSSGIAPGAKIRIYASGTLDFVNLDAALDRIIADLPSQPGMRQVSISLGLGETFMAKAEVRTQHAKFLKLAAAGVNVFISSGDAGASPDVTGHSSSGPVQAEYEASDPAVIGVGGTSLKLTSAGAVASETGWTGSGGGKSIFFPRPAWQHGTGVASGTQRLVPDVSSLADPNTGAMVVLSGTPQQFGGTSLSAPTWAGFCALLNEARANASKPPLPFLNPLIYPLSGSPSFRDITSGNNGAFNAGPGHDLVTGIGVPNIKALATALTT